MEVDIFSDVLHKIKELASLHNVPSKIPLTGGHDQKNRYDSIIGCEKTCLSHMLHINFILNRQSVPSPSSDAAAFLSGSVAEGTFATHTLTPFTSDQDVLQIIKTEIVLRDIAHNATGIHCNVIPSMPVYYKVNVFDEFGANQEFSNKLFKEHLYEGLCKSYSGSVEMSGPAFKICNLSSGVKDDIVYALDFPAQGIDLFENWKNRHRIRELFPHDVIEEVMSSRCYLVPTGNNAMDDVHWRLSFSNAEKTLMHKLHDIYLSIYFYAKFIKATQSSIPSYYMKTAFLWMIEEIPARKWVPGNIYDLVQTLLQKTSLFLIKGHLPHYFIPEQNLLQGISRDQLHIYREQSIKCKCTVENLLKVDQIPVLSKSGQYLRDDFKDNILSIIVRKHIWDTALRVSRTYNDKIRNVYTTDLIVNNKKCVDEVFACNIPFALWVELHTSLIMHATSSGEALHTYQQVLKKRVPHYTEYITLDWKEVDDTQILDGLIELHTLLVRRLNSLQIFQNDDFEIPGKAMYVSNKLMTDLKLLLDKLNLQISQLPFTDTCEGYKMKIDLFTKAFALTTLNSDTLTSQSFVMAMNNVPELRNAYYLQLILDSNTEIRNKQINTDTKMRLQSVKLANTPDYLLMFNDWHLPLFQHCLKLYKKMEECQQNTVLGINTIRIRTEFVVGCLLGATEENSVNEVNRK